MEPGYGHGAAFFQISNPSEWLGVQSGRSSLSGINPLPRWDRNVQIHSVKHLKLRRAAFTLLHLVPAVSQWQSMKRWMRMVIMRGTLRENNFKIQVLGHCCPVLYTKRSGELLEYASAVPMKLTTVSPPEVFLSQTATDFINFCWVLYGFSFKLEPNWSMPIMALGAMQKQLKIA